MKRFVLWPSVLLAFLFVAGPALAAGKAEATPAKTRHLTGQVVSVDAQAKVLTVKRMAKGKAHEYTFTADKDAAQALAQLKPGERVTISYVVSGSTLTAEKVVGMVHAAATAGAKK